MKVEIIEERSRFDLEDKINKRLRNYTNDKIIDIKYTGNGNSSAYSTNYYSAMIIYK